MSLMTAVSSQVSVGATTAVKIWASDIARVQGEIKSDSTMYIGGSDVSSSNGFKVAAGTTTSVPTSGAQAEMWAISAAGTITVDALEFKAL
jgi:hypothetical protein